VIDAELIADLDRSFAAALDHDDPVKARAALLDAGWLDALETDQEVATALVFRAQGRTGVDAGALDDVVGRRVAARWPDAADVAVAYPVITSAAAGTSRPTHVVFAVNSQARRLLWVPDLRGGRLEVVELDRALDAPALRGVDPAAGLLGLAGRPGGRVTELGGAEAASAWGPALAAGRTALAHQLVAGAHAQLVMATAYAQDRRQFGVAIASFQAIKHRLADTLVAISAADAAALAAGATGSEWSAVVAKALAGRASAVAARNCLQVFGGIGFTEEHEYQRRFRRNLVLERLLGDGRTLERELGAQLRVGSLDAEHVVELEQLPRIAPLTSVR
jgi:alkylation response protein AidB-like acyl-CoA dehydrogenase